MRKPRFATEARCRLGESLAVSLSCLLIFASQDKPLDLVCKTLSPRASSRTESHYNQCCNWRSELSRNPFNHQFPSETFTQKNIRRERERDLD
eukprot:1046186-Amphidinium_carterae.1